MPAVQKHLGQCRSMMQRLVDTSLLSLFCWPKAQKSMLRKRNQELRRSMRQQKGADPNICSKEGVSPLHVALENGNFGIANRIRQHGAANPGA